MASAFGLHTPLEDEDDQRYFATHGVRGNDLERGLILPEGIASMPKEYTKLTQRLFFSPASGQPSVVAFTGADGMADTDSVCANVAYLLAFQSGLPVLSMHLNDQRPKLLSLSGTNTALPGFAEALEWPGSVRDFARRVSGSLWTMSSPSQSGAILPWVTSARFGQFVGKIRSEFRYALIACPSVGLEPASIPICVAADTSVVVVGSKSRRASAQDAVLILRRMGIQLAGAVLEQPRGARS